MHVDLSKGTGFMYLLLYLPQQFTDIQLIAFCSACATNKSVKTVLNINIFDFYVGGGNLLTTVDCLIKMKCTVRCLFANQLFKIIFHCGLCLSNYF